MNDSDDDNSETAKDRLRERGKGMEVEKDNSSNNSEGVKGDIESEESGCECKDSKEEVTMIIMLVQ